MYNNKKDGNNAQKAREDKSFNDSKKEESSKKINGTDVPVTYWSDGSTTTHFGGPVGDYESDENGEEC